MKTNGILDIPSLYTRGYETKYVLRIQVDWDVMLSGRRLQKFL